MAVLTFSKYPPVEKQLANLTGSHFGSSLTSAPRRDTYCYNIKEELRDYKSKDRFHFNLFKRSNQTVKDSSGDSEKQSTRYRVNSKIETISEKESRSPFMTPLSPVKIQSTDDNNCLVTEQTTTSLEDLGAAT